MTTPELIQGYDSAVDALLQEITACQAGDSIDLHVFLVEPAASTDRTMDALRAAAGRGVTVTLSIDSTLTSLVSRVWEWVPTYLGQARALGREVEGLSFKARALADHSKYGLFLRPQAQNTALLGGINLGDRFSPWRDFMVRLRDPAHVSLLRQVLAGKEPAPTVPPAASSVSFAANVPKHGLIGVAPTFRALLDHSDYALYRFAMAYIDHDGARLLHRALDRGAEVELILPRAANVYHDANMRYLNRLRARSDRMRAYLCPDMVHAKAMVAVDQSSAPLAFFGSCNLKRASLRRLGELNALISEPSFAADLDQALVGLRDEGERVTEEKRYFWVKAVFEEILG